MGWRPSQSAAPYRWEFVENGTPFDVAVEPQITTNDLHLMIRTALAGGEITFALEEMFRPYLDRGELVTAMDDFLPPFPGFFLYFLDRRNMAPKLRALIDHVRTHKLTQLQLPGARRPAPTRYCTADSTHNNGTAASDGKRPCPLKSAGRC